MLKVHQKRHSQASVSIPTMQQTMHKMEFQVQKWLERKSKKWENKPRGNFKQTNSGENSKDACKYYDKLHCSCGVCWFKGNPSATNVIGWGI